MTAGIFAGLANVLSALGAAFAENSYLIRNSALTGSADSPSISASIWVRRPVGDTGVKYMTFLSNGPSGGAPSLQIGSQNRSASRHFLFFGLSVQSTSVSVSSEEISKGQWHHILISGPTNNLRMWLDGSATPSSGSSSSVASFPLQGCASVEVNIANSGSGGTASPMDIAFFWLSQQPIDFTNASNRAKFISAGRPVDLGVNGELPTGSPPLIYFSGDSGFSINRGAGGAFTKTGTITSAGQVALS